MSWKEIFENSKFSITTGDGKVFYPLWKEANKSTEFNATSFEFINRSGTYVDRRKPKSSKYDLLIFFQGENCNTVVDDFENSAKDNRYWVIQHPIYGVLKGQPTSLERSDTNMNVVEVSIEFWESIITKDAEKVQTIKDEIDLKKENLDNESANNFELKTNTKPINQNKVREFINTLDGEYKKLLDDSGYNKYQEVLSKARDSVDGMIIDSRSLILDVSRTIDAIKNIPNVNVFQKITSLSNLFNQLISEFTFKQITDFNRFYFESAGASIISTMATIGLNPGKNDYNSRNDVKKVSSIIDNTYKNYFEILNVFEFLRDNKNNNYGISFSIQSELNSIVKKTIFEMFSISFNYKQERIIELKNDSNLILLCHKYMGLDDNDEKLELFRSINEIKNDRLFIVKKGFKIKYFI